MPATTKPELLAEVPLFSACNRKELKLVSDIASRLDVAAGEEVVREGGTGRDFFVVAEGSLDVTHDGKKLATLGRGDFFGEMSLLDLGPRSATVTAAEDSMLYVITARDFSKMLDDVPIVARRVLTALSGRLRLAQGSPVFQWNLPDKSWNRK